MKRPILKMLVAAVSMCLTMPLVSCVAPNPGLGSVSSIQGTMIQDEYHVVTIEGDIEEGTSVELFLLNEEQTENALKFLTSEDYDPNGQIYAYDISLIKDGAEIEPNGKLKVTLDIPNIDTTRSYNVFHLKDNQSIERIVPKIEPGKVIFETSSFSIFLIVPEAEEVTSSSLEEPPVSSSSEESSISTSQEDTSIISSTEETKAEVFVSINILPLAEYGALKVNGKLLSKAASYKAKHSEGDEITVEAIPADGHHFDYWGEEEVLSTESVYTFTVGKEEVHFGAIFTDGHVLSYSDITITEHKETCIHGDYEAIVPHAYVNEKILTEGSCKGEGTKQLSCACGMAKTEPLPATDHHFEDGVCTVCGDIQTYLRCTRFGVADPQGGYIKMGLTYAEKAPGYLWGLLTEQVGSPYLTNYANWTPYDFGNGDTTSTYYADTVYEGVRYRGVCIVEARKDNDSMQTTCARYWPDIYWFQERPAMWRIVKENNGKALLIANNIWISQRFAESDEGPLTYQNSWIRSWIQTYQDDLFTPEQKAILEPNENCYGDKIFIPSYDEIGLNHNIDFGYYQYPVCLGAYYDAVSGMGSTYCPYWLRDRISTAEDGLNYVECVPSHAPFDATVKYPANKTFVAAVPSVIIRL